MSDTLHTITTDPPIWQPVVDDNDEPVPGLAVSTGPTRKRAKVAAKRRMPSEGTLEKAIEERDAEAALALLVEAGEQIRASSKLRPGGISVMDTALARLRQEAVRHRRNQHDILKAATEELR